MDEETIRPRGHVMSHVGIDVAAAMDLGEQIVDIAEHVAEAGMALTADSCGLGFLSEPPATGAALTTFAIEYGSGIQRLHDDVVALGRLVQATAMDFEDVDAAAAGMGG